MVDDSEAQYLAFFAGKTIAMIRAPDQYVYPPPFNLLEIFLIVPFELVILPRYHCNSILTEVQIYSLKKKLRESANISAHITSN